MGGGQQYHYQKNSKFDPESDEEDDDDYDEADSPINVSWIIPYKIRMWRKLSYLVYVFFIAFCLILVHTSQPSCRNKELLTSHPPLCIFKWNNNIYKNDLYKHHTAYDDDDSI